MSEWNRTKAITAVRWWNSLEPSRQKSFIEFCNTRFLGGDGDWGEVCRICGTKVGVYWYDSFLHYGEKHPDELTLWALE